MFSEDVFSLIGSVSQSFKFLICCIYWVQLLTRTTHHHMQTYFPHSLQGRKKKNKIHQSVTTTTTPSTTQILHLPRLFTTNTTNQTLHPKTIHQVPQYPCVRLSHHSTPPHTVSHHHAIPLCHKQPLRFLPSLAPTSCAQWFWDVVVQRVA